MKKYAIISNKKRNELIERVVKSGESVSRVSKQLRMKLPSAKSIIRTYKKNGKIFDKKKIINRKIISKRSDLSETENHSCVQMSQGSKMEEKLVKEETISKG